ncbi:GAF and ANTAR domain-containing protein [Antrihabitans cavernicola]|uniref:GAF and ANTAR domain-containing protein n=1 Tax=Antrihabitans cavernicola TaxID=2495913 RepID=UPI001BE41469|nr:GAF and ANTAR domain-containing protein [Spelaeibacter cavernicola]
MSEPADTAGDTSVQAVRAAVLAALHDGDSELDALGRVCRACVDLLPVDGASITVIDGTAHHETLYASDEVSARLESIQFTLGEGPSFHAFATRGPVLVPDLATATTAAWPVFAAEIADLPVAALFVFPIQSGAIAIGSFGLYRSRAGPLVPDELSIALQVADIAAIALLHMGAIADVDDDEHYEHWLTQLPRSSVEVHQATGMLISQLGLPAAQALSRLRGHAFATGRLVHDVAADVIARRVDLSKPDE